MFKKNKKNQLFIMFTIFLYFSFSNKISCRLRTLNFDKLPEIYNYDFLEIKEKTKTFGNETKTESTNSTENTNKTSTKLKQINSTNTKRVVQTQKTESENIPKNLDYTQATNITCTTQNCKQPNICLADKKTCKCANNKAEYEINRRIKMGENPVDTSKIKVFCEYDRKKQIIYFLLEFILNIGIGHLYAGNVSQGIVKMVLVFLPCLIFSALICLGVMSSSKIDQMAVVGYGLITLLFCTILIWWMVDIILISLKYYTDGNGVPLMSW